METLDGGIDRQFVKRYKKFLLQFNDLRDCAYSGGLDGGKHLYRFSDSQLEEFRNYPKSHYVEIERNGRPGRLYRGTFTPSLDGIAKHLIVQAEHTIWMTNAASANTLLMLADIDTDDGDAQAAAKYLSSKYLRGCSSIEPSTGGKGRHGYFQLSVTYTKRALVWEKLREIAGRIREDDRFAHYGCDLDNVFYGLPTIWTQVDGRWNLEKRGDCLKLPYCSNSQADLDKLRALEVIPFDAFVASFPAKVSVLMPTTAADSPSVFSDTSGLTHSILRVDGQFGRSSCWAMSPRIKEDRREEVHRSAGSR